MKKQEKKLSLSRGPSRRSDLALVKAAAADLGLSLGESQCNCLKAERVQ